jgi:hypothetical protein
VANIIYPTVMPYAPVLTFPALRKALARIVKAGAPNALVRERWALRFDLTKAIADIKAKSGVDAGKVHAWLIAISGATLDVSRTGRGYFEWLLTVRVWGFRYYELGDDNTNSQDVVEAEARYVAALMYLNRSQLALDNPAATGFRGVERDLNFPPDSIDVVGFAEGVDVHVAQGEMVVRVAEQL